jgi:hypothetical protein
MPNIIETKPLSTADLADAANDRDRDRQEVEQSHRGPSEDQYSGPLLPSDYSADMRTRWETIQTGFVDDPRIAVQHADELVATAIKKLAESFAGERGKLEEQWSKGNDVSTEDLRQALRRYRAFFHRLLSI